MIRRSTVVYIIVLLGLVGVYFYLSNRKLPAGVQGTATPESQINYLFKADDGSLTGIKIKANAGNQVELARSAENAWMLTQPNEAAADQAASEAAASQVGTMRILEKIPQIDLDLVGLKDPAYVLTIKFKNGTERTVHIGVVTPTESGYYVQDATGGDVLIISKSSVDALLGLLTTPPYKETPTPNPDLAGTAGPHPTPTT